MRTPVTLSTCMWRRVVGAALVFALVVHALVFALASGALAGNIADDPNWPGFELCRHDADNAPAPSHGLPVSDSDCDMHCVLCVAASAPVLAAPEFSLTFLSAAAEKVSWSLTEWHFPPWSTRDPTARPRGPPLTA